MSTGLVPPDLSTFGAARDLSVVFARTAAEHDRTGAFPFDNFPLLHRAGLPALRTPTRFGGHGAGIGEAARVIGAIASGQPATALVLAMHYIQHARAFWEITAVPDIRVQAARIARQLADDTAPDTGSMRGDDRVEP